MALAPEWRPSGRARYGGAVAGDGRGREARQRRWRSGGWRCRVKDWEKCTADVDKIMNKHFRSGCTDSKIQHIVIYYNVWGLTVEGCWQTWQTRAVSAHYQMESSSANPDVSKWDVSQVEDMGSMFFKSGIKKANLSNWNLKEELINNSDYTKAMFSYCGDLEYLKTPKGFKTSINEVDKDFKLVKLKKGSSVNIENEKVNLKDKYEVNKDGDKEAVYHIYRKDKYAGVTFDKNGGDKEA